MASNWSAPKTGTPCWINILATDVPRAQKFYSTVFDWQFKTATSDGRVHDPSEIALFRVPGGGSDGSPGGGITRVPSDQWVSGGGKRGVILYLWVDKIQGFDEKVVAAGGRKVTEVEPEGEHALQQMFEDTEGNSVAIYSIK